MSRRIASVLIVAAPLLLVAWCFWPGHMSSDTLAQIEQARSGDFNDLHAPLLMALWRPWYQVGFGPGWALLIQLAVFGAAVFMLLEVVMRPRAAALATALISLSPVVFGMLGYLSRDVWYSELILLSFACVAQAARNPSRRRAFAIGAVAAAWLALAARQNAVFTVPVALAVLASLLAGDRLGKGKKRAWFTAGVGIAATVALFATVLVGNKVIGAQDARAEQYLFLYDLAALSQEQGENLFPTGVLPDPATNIREFSPQDVATIAFGRVLVTPLPAPTVSRLQDAWVDAVTSDPLGYLEMRARMLGRLLAIGQRANFIYHPVVDPNTSGFRAEHVEANTQAKDYVEGFADPNLNGGILYTLWAYLLAAVVAGIVLIRTRLPGPSAIGWAAVSVLPFQIGLFALIPTNNYRFEFPMVLMALVAVVAAVATLNSPQPRKDYDAALA